MATTKVYEDSPLNVPIPHNNEAADKLKRKIYVLFIICQQN